MYTERLFLGSFFGATIFFIAKADQVSQRKRVKFRLKEKAREKVN